MIIVEICKYAFCIVIDLIGICGAAFWAYKFFKAVKERNRHEDPEVSVSGSDEKPTVANPKG